MTMVLLPLFSVVSDQTFAMFKQRFKMDNVIAKKDQESARWQK
jgi:hypothetical protein